MLWCNLDVGWQPAIAVTAFIDPPSADGYTEQRCFFVIPKRHPIQTHDSWEVHRFSRGNIIAEEGTPDRAIEAVVHALELPASLRPSATFLSSLRKLGERIIAQRMNLRCPPGYAVVSLSGGGRFPVHATRKAKREENHRQGQMFEVGLLVPVRRQR